MAKFGCMNNLELTREMYRIKEDITTIKNNLDIMDKKHNSFLDSIFDKGESYIHNIVDIIKLKSEQETLSKKFEYIIDKLQTRKIEPIQITHVGKEELKTFLTDNNLEHLLDYLLKLGVNKVEDIMFVHENDMEIDGISIVDIRKCLHMAKESLENEVYI